MIKNCDFCRIVNNRNDSAIFWEDNNCLALLDIHPNTFGMSLVITKKHLDSEIFELKNSDYLNLMIATKKVVNILKRRLNVKRVAIVIEGLEINHAHIKLYPMHGLQKEFVKIVPKGGVYFDKYEGYITTKFGPKVDIKELKLLAEKIKKIK